MRKISYAFLLLFLAVGLCFWIFRSQESLKNISNKFERSVSTTRIEQQMHALASKPHRAGTPENFQTGEEILKRLRAIGLSPVVEEFEAVIAEPVEARCLLTAPETIDLPLFEKELPQDPFSAAAPQQLPYFAFSPDCDLEAGVVYANYGSQDDYAFLKSHGIELKGKIALVRAQGICRGLKALIAQKEGIAGLLLYPELRDQGFRKTPFPNGPHTNLWTSQRGSLLAYFLHPGDPSLDSSAIPVIPAIPISESNAVQILRNISGPRPPEDWIGWQDVQYRFGDGPARVRMVYREQRRKVKLRNILASIDGQIKDEPAILAGNHYDAWVYGSSDPASGTAAMLESIQLLAELQKSGWKPRRTIRFALWDGEEFGMYGSTEWIRRHADQLNGGYAAYINVDSAYRSKEFVGNVMPGLKGLLDATLTQVQEPLSGTAISEIRGDYQDPGFSSDAGPFIGLTSMPVAEIGFGRWYGVYHSLYDDVYWMEHFGDPGYRYHAALARILALYLYQLSSNELLPFHFSEIAEYSKVALHAAGVDSLHAEMQRFEDIAKRTDLLLNSKQKWNAADAARINAILVRSIASFSENSANLPYGTRNVLLGTSVTEGCAGEQLPGIRESHSSTVEIERLRTSLVHAATLLEEANWLLEGKQR